MAGRPSVARIASLLLLVLGLFGCDHATKIAAKVTLEGAEAAMAVAPGVLRGSVELVYVENDDMAFNALRVLGVPRSPAILIGLSAVAIASLVVMAIVARRRLGSSRGGRASVPNGNSDANAAYGNASAAADGNAIAAADGNAIAAVDGNAIAAVDGNANAAVDRNANAVATAIEGSVPADGNANGGSRGIDRATQAGFALVLGGALCNIVDRAVRGYVIDFIHVKGWPVFNVADVAVVAGMILLALPRLGRRRPRAAPSGPTLKGADP